MQEIKYFIVVLKPVKVIKNREASFGMYAYN
jgi:hypothetical protein